MVYKLYCVFSKESIAAMKGNRGKMAAQAGHAYLHSFWDAEVRFPEDAAAYRSPEIGNEQHPQKAYKICLIAETNEDLLNLVKYQQDRCGVTTVIDAGLTVFGEPTLTCVGIGPVSEENQTEKLKSLKVFI